MDLSTATYWWVAAGVLVAVELTTGTFYLLMVALGLAAAALAAHSGAAASVQVATAALVGGGATALWHWRRFKQPRSAHVSENPDANLDIGGRIQVIEWAADRTARVRYRGSDWFARLAPGQAARSGEHTVIAVEGSTLVLQPATTADTRPTD